jgi:hypothetical protein
MQSRNVVISRTTRRLRRFTKEQRKPLSQPGLLYPLNEVQAVCKKKAREAAEKALAKAQDSKSEAQEAKKASKVNDNSMKAGFLEDLEKAKQAQSTAKGAMTERVNYLR